MTIKTTDEVDAGGARRPRHATRSNKLRVSFSDIQEEVREVCHKYPSDFFYTKRDVIR